MLRLAFIACALAAALSAQAEQIKVFGPRDNVDPAEVARILQHGHRPLKMRSIRLLDDGAAGARIADTPAAPAALSLPVQFKFDSAEILPDARPQLDAIAAGIRMLPPTQTVLIEGHTDTIGSDGYNEQLSQRRAHSVRRYLIAQHQIDGARLRAVGRGETATLPGREPTAPENRRVQFRGD
jgi:OmpA-OmpF porin, OOP family